MNQQVKGKERKHRKHALKRVQKRCDSPNVFVGGIPPELEPSDIMVYLIQFDKLIAFEMPKNLNQVGWKGFAKAQLASPEGVRTLLSQPLHFVKGLEVGIKAWIDKQEYLLEKDDISRRKVFVKFQPYLSTEQLFMYFSQFGQIESIENKTNLHTKQARNFGFIVFKKEEDAIKATTYGSRATSSPKIWVELTRPKYLMDMNEREELDPQISQNPRSGFGNSCTFCLGKSRNLTSYGHASQFSNSRLLESRQTRGQFLEHWDHQPHWQGPQSLANNSPQCICHHFGFANFRSKAKDQPTPGITLNTKALEIGGVHDTKPTSNHYSQYARKNISMNHQVHSNVHFRLVRPH